MRTRLKGELKFHEDWKQRQTQKKAPHVPLTLVSFMPARKLPYKMSALVVTNSAMGIKPPGPEPEPDGGRT